MVGRDQTRNGDRPIAKPSFPLPQVFNRKTPKLSLEEVALKDQRAYFYKRDVTEAGTPVYGFFITAEDDDAGENH